MNSTTDAELCRSFVDGDVAAFGTLMARHQSTVFNVVRRYAANRDDALDLVQRAFLQAFKAARDSMQSILKEQGAEFPFRAWVLRIAVNLGKNGVRDQARRPTTSLEVVDRERENSNTAHTALERAQQDALVRDAILHLTPRQAEVFSLRIDADLSFADVAATLHITETNAKTQFHQAVKRLRDVVQHKLSQGASR